jgi:hypothetical protein
MMNGVEMNETASGRTEPPSVQMEPFTTLSSFRLSMGLFVWLFDGFEGESGSRRKFIVARDVCQSVLQTGN